MNMISLLIIQIALAKYAVYIHTTQYTIETKSTYTCISKNNITNIIIAGYEAFGNQGIVDSAANRIKLAQEAGIPQIDIFVNAFPNFYPPPAASQVAQDTFNAFNGKIKMAWIRAGNLEKDIGTNQDYIKQLVNAFQKLSMAVGIFTDSSDWNMYYGQYSGVSALSLLYLGGTQPNFLDFLPFGGWTKPSMKLFNDDTTYCKLSIGHLYY